MGFLSVYSGIKRVVIDTDRGYWVDLKEHISQGDREAAERSLASMVISDGKTNISPDVTSWREQLIHATISTWNLDDDDNTVWPITLDNIRRLPGNVFDQLWKEVDALNSTRKGEDQQRFRDGDLSGDSNGDTGAPVA